MDYFVLVIPVCLLYVYGWIHVLRSFVVSESERVLVESGRTRSSRVVSCRVDSGRVDRRQIDFPL